MTLSNGVVRSRVIGDHAVPDLTASGEADIRCPYAYSITEKVNLNCAYSIPGTYSTFESSGWKADSNTAGIYLDLWTPFACRAGAEPTLWWTTYAWISISGSPMYEAWSQKYKIFEPTYR